MDEKCIPLEILERYQENFNKKEGRRYPCSNQVVLCGIFTEDKDKAIDFMRDKTVIKKIERQYEINWFLDNGERWMWRRKWNDNIRGYRFYKLVIDKFIDINSFRNICYQSYLYCCSMEII